MISPEELERMLEAKRHPCGCLSSLFICFQCGMCSKHGECTCDYEEDPYSMGGTLPYSTWEKK